MNGSLFNTTQEPKFHEQAYTHPFLTSALQYHSLDLPVIPCMGDNGKVACVKWACYRDRRPSYKEVTSWQSQFPKANVGLLTGAVSGLTVVDIDTGKPEIINQMVSHFGDTPIKIKTPSGGMHLYYRFNDEQSHTGIEGLPVDVRASGGYVIAPPSVHPRSQSVYKFMEGSINKVKNLPTLRRGSLPKSVSETEPDILDGDIAPQGQRNHALFKALLQRARECSTLDELEDSAFLLNETFLDPPLEHDEVKHIIANIWRIKIENRLYGGGERFLTIISSEIHNLKDHPKAFWLLANLKNAHENKRKEFALSLDAMTKAIGWTVEDLREARDVLLQKQYLKLIRQGGNGEGDVSLYGFAV
ncbi:MAG: bifunctional DNA primase/polymerase [Alphaproteobacteria bacterium]|nr:bifunctional DNA primase/polymerase [Alphaproteobacteria bacterium]